MENVLVKALPIAPCESNAAVPVPVVFSPAGGYYVDLHVNFHSYCSLTALT